MSSRIGDFLGRTVQGVKSNENSPTTEAQTPAAQISLLLPHFSKEELPELIGLLKILNPEDISEKLKDKIDTALQKIPLKDLDSTSKDMFAQIQFFLENKFFPHDPLPSEKSSAVLGEAFAATKLPKKDALEALPKNLVAQCKAQDKESFAKKLVDTSSEAMRLYTPKEQQEFCKPENFFSLQAQLIKEINKELGGKKETFKLAEELAHKCMGNMLITAMGEPLQQKLPELLADHFKAFADVEFLSGKGADTAFAFKAGDNAGQLLKALCEHPSGKLFVKQLLKPEHRVAFQKELVKTLSDYEKNASKYAEFIMDGVLKEAATSSASKTQTLMLDKLSAPTFSGNVELTLPLADGAYLDASRQLNASIHSGKDAKLQLTATIEKGKLKNLTGTLDGRPAIQTQVKGVNVTANKAEIQMNEKGELHLKTKILTTLLDVNIERQLFSLNLDEKSTLKDLFEKNLVRKAKREASTESPKLRDILHDKEPLEFKFNSNQFSGAPTEGQVKMAVNLTDFDGVELPKGLSITSKDCRLEIQLKRHPDGSIDEKNTSILLTPPLTLNVLGVGIISLESVTFRKNTDGSLSLNASLPGSGFTESLVNLGLNQLLKTKLQGNSPTKSLPKKTTEPPLKEASLTGFKPLELLEFFQLNNIEYTHVTLTKSDFGS